MMCRKLTAVLVATLAAAFAVSAAQTVPLTDEQRAVHLLNRIAFGPRPGDVDTVRRVGIDEYIDQQLHPERIPDPAISSRLSALGTLGLSARDIAGRYERPALEARRQRKAEAVSLPNLPAAAGAGRQMDPERQAANLPLVELSEQKVLRAVYSERQLQEVLADFWFNHFNVDARKGPERYLLTEYERDVIRPHVLGRFRALLEATARSQAMLFYLDNWMSADPNGPHANAMRPALRRGPFQRFPPPTARPAEAKNAPKGLNENYGRELLELHTLGVDGGYTQKDVTEVARAFTGWTIANPRQGGGFTFSPRLHDEGAKLILGHRIKAGGGEHDGEEVLDVLAAHPSTARFIATKLARRFVSDTPPPALVDRLATTFTRTGGDLRAVMAMLLKSPEFNAPEAYRAKVKSPFEFVVAAVRATGIEVDDARPLVRAVQQLGMPLYQCQPPTGYKDTADAWVNTGALVNRMNVALTLANLPAARQDRSDIGPGDVMKQVLGGDVSDATRATIDKAPTVPQALALTLGSPEFQRR